MIYGADKFIEWLKSEALLWVSEGIISEESKQKILSRYGDEYFEHIKVQKQGRVAQTIVTLGAILIGAGVLLFISANWDTIAKGLKLFIIFSSIVAAYGAGFWLTEINYKRTGEGLLFLGALLYGAGIALIAQIYNIEANSGTIFLLWGLGVMLTGAALRSELFLSFGAILFMFWTVFARNFGSGLFFGQNPVNDLHLAYLVIAIILFALSYVWKKEKLLAFNILGLFIWFSMALVAWQAGVITSILFYLAFGAFLLLVSFLQIQFGGFSRTFVLPYSFFGLSAVAATSYILTFNYILNSYASGEYAGIDVAYSYVLGAFAGCVIIGSFIIFLMPQIKSFFRFGFAGLSVLLIFAFIFLMFPVAPETTQWQYSYRYMDTLNPYTYAWNIIATLEILGIIVLGYAVSERRYVNIGIIFFGLLVMSRYFDVFSLYFGTYASFIIGGILFIALGFVLERFRKKILSKLSANPAINAAG